MLDVYNSPLPDSGEPSDGRRRLLLLARPGDPWGSAATVAASGAGYAVEQLAEAEELVAALDGAAANDRDVVAAVVVAGALASAPPQTARQLSAKSAESGLPVVLLAEPGQPPGADLAALPHVTVVETPPSEPVLAAVLSGARREREARRRVRRLNAELAAADRRERDLLARVGHELRNPLGAITSALSLITETRGDDPTAGERYRRLIERQVETLRRAVDGLLGGQPVHRADNDNQTTEPAPQGAEPSAGPGPWAMRNDFPVLLVEDDADGREALGELVARWGYDVEVAADGEEGVAKAAARPPRVALVDVGLPGIDGCEVARRIRRAFPERPPLLIAMTGFGRPDDRRRVLDAGFDLHLVKPVQPRELSRLLARAAAGEP